MTGDATQHLDKQENDQPFDLDSLKRELWMRVLGIKSGAEKHGATESNNMAGSLTTTHASVNNH